MSAGDTFLFEVAQRAVLTSLDEPEAILYRQDILADCLEHSAIVREMYDIVDEAIEPEKRIGFWSCWVPPRDPSGLLYRSVQVLQFFVGVLRRLRRIADEQGAKFRSDGGTPSACLPRSLAMNT